MSTSKGSAGDASDTGDVTIVGAGLVGCLTALALGQRGFQVTVLEAMPDIRTLPQYTGRSINLALSCHGLEGLDVVGLGDEWRESGRGIPMHARYIHNADGSTTQQPYGAPGEHILSVDRRLLNIRLMEEAEKLDNVTFQFNAAVQSIDYKKKHIVYAGGSSNDEAAAAAAAAGHSAEAATSGVEALAQTLIERDTDLIVGADGAHSAVRTSLLGSRRFDFTQSYIDHGYKELNMAPVDDDWALPKNYLHIWPRHEFMLIALPNEDKSFTVTLFMPFDGAAGGFDTINTDEEIVAFMETHFADAVPLLGDYVHDWHANRTGPLKTVYCSRYHYGDSVMLMGDAAHAVCPFAGEGMNSSFQNLVRFDRLLDTMSFTADRAALLEAYSAAEVPAGHAVAQIALDNYIEMRSSTASALFLLRKRIEAVMHAVLGDLWIPRYTMVHFTNMPYNVALETAEWQDTVISRVSTAASLVSLASIGLGVWHFFGSAISAALPTVPRPRLPWH